MFNVLEKIILNKEDTMYEHHEIADIYKMMTGENWTKFMDSINTQGLLVPITLYEGKILDGRNRYKACLELGVEPRFEQYDGDNPIDFVIALNEERRHLSVAERAVAALKVANMKRGGDRKNQTAPGQFDPFGNTIKEAAGKFGISERTVNRTAKLQKEAPELLEKAVNGEISLKAAGKSISMKTIGININSSAGRSAIGNIGSLDATVGLDCSEWLDKIQAALDKKRAEIKTKGRTK